MKPEARELLVMWMVMVAIVTITAVVLLTLYGCSDSTTGPHTAEWDGRTVGGARVGPGIYWAQLQTGGERLVERVVVLR